MSISRQFKGYLQFSLTAAAPVIFCVIRILCVQTLAEGDVDKTPAGESTTLLSASVLNREGGSTNTTTVAVARDLDNVHRLAAGDRISYRVLEDKEEPKSLVVADSGELEIPYYGRISATNKTCQRLGSELKLLLEKDLYYTATVVVAVDQLNPKRGTVYMVGQVRATGPVLMPSDDPLTLSKAILKAGGFAEFADKKRVRITRRGGGKDGKIDVFVVNVAEILEKGRSDKDMQLEPDDLVYVPERRINF